MKHEEIETGIRVRVSDGREGEVVGYDASFGLSLSGGGMRRRGTSNLKAEILFDDESRGSFRISSLKVVQ